MQLEKEGGVRGGASRRTEVAREGIRGVYRRGWGWKEKGVLDKRLYPGWEGVVSRERKG